VYQFNTDRALADEAAVTFNTGLVHGPKTARPLTQGFDGWTAEDSAYLRRNKYIQREQVHADAMENIKAKTLAPAFVTARPKSAADKLDERYTSGMFSGGDAYSFDIMDDPTALGMTDIFQYLQGRVPGLLVNPGQGPGGVPSLSWRGGRPTLYLNEMQVDPSQLQSVSVPDVAYLKVFRPGSGVGFGGGSGGTIAVYTKKGGDSKNTDPNFKGLPKTTLIGYSMPKEFYSPNYLENPQVEKEDLRTTLYWKPYLMTDKDNSRVSVDFFNNDVTKKLRVVLEGFNENGKLTHIEQIIQ
ncbi:MAG TPA: hypothetical protein VKU83_08800, partial [Puia sp.]|nr:hypothetical protein [Puia sp.]